MWRIVKRGRSVPHRVRNRQSSMSVRQGEKNITSLLRRRPLQYAGFERLTPIPRQRTSRTTGRQRPFWDSKGVRFPLMRLLSERGVEYTMMQSPMDFMKGLRDTLTSGPVMSARTSICESRGARRRVLFKIGIAGHGKRKSPGQGGSYRRNEQSKKQCEVSYGRRK